MTQSQPGQRTGTWWHVASYADVPSVSLQSRTNGASVHLQQTALPAFLGNIAKEAFRSSKLKSGYCKRIWELLTNKREKKYDSVFNDLQAALWGSAGQTGGTYVLIPAGGVPERVLSRPPDPNYEEEAPREGMTLEAAHDSQQHLNQAKKRQQKIRVYSQCCLFITLASKISSFPSTAGSKLISPHTIWWIFNTEFFQ